jgi:hypothetical protein
LLRGGLVGFHLRDGREALLLLTPAVVRSLAVRQLRSDQPGKTTRVGDPRCHRRGRADLTLSVSRPALSFASGAAVALGSSQDKRGFRARDRRRRHRPP